MVRAIQYLLHNRQAAAKTCALVLMLGGLTACDLPGPHVYDPDRFDRESPTYGQDPADILEVTICYNASSTRAKAVADLASEQCGRFRKTAVFVSQAIDHCPLFNPISANYICVREGDAAPRR